jgi:uncharacterized protein (DUF58 family)
MRNVPRWQAGLLASITLAGAGFLFGRAILLVSGVVPLGYTLYATVSTVPTVESAVTAERHLSPESPIPGETVRVTTTIVNETDRTLPDVRIVDGVPDELALVSGSDRCATTLRPEETVEVTYELQPQRGSYTFTDPRVRLRSVSAAAISTSSISADGVTSFECRIPLDGIPVHQRTTPFVGSVLTSSGGAGHEFHSTREYRHGDPLSRIDWRRYAKTGDLGTVLFREQEASRVVVVVDGRSESAVTSTPGMPDGTTLSSYAGIVTASALSDAGHQVGVAGLGISSNRPDVYTGPPAFVEPSTGSETLARIALVCDTIAAGSMTVGSAHPTVSSSQPDPANRDGVSNAAADGGFAGGISKTDRSGLTSVGTDVVDTLDALVDRNTQFVVCSPVIDQDAVELIGGLRRRGFPTTVVGPDVTSGDAVGSRVAALRRSARITRLRRLDVPVVDWDPETPLQRALADGLGEVIR